MTLIERIIKEQWVDMNTGKIIVEMALDSRTFQLPDNVIAQLKHPNSFEQG